MASKTIPIPDEYQTLFDYKYKPHGFSNLHIYEEHNARFVQFTYKEKSLVSMLISGRKKSIETFDDLCVLIAERLQNES